MPKQELIDSIVSSAKQAQPLDARAQRIVVSLYRLLASGEPLSVASIAHGLSLSDEEVEAFVAMVPAAALDRDDEGNIVAFVGLSLKPTCHRMDSSRNTLFGWCAFDLLFLSLLLGENVDIRSQDPQSKKLVEFRFGPDGYHGPPEVQMSLMSASREEMRDNVRASFCHQVFFFADSASFDAYAVANPSLVAISVAEAALMAEKWNKEIYGEALAVEQTGLG